jgi:hypothetical protein
VVNFGGYKCLGVFVGGKLFLVVRKKLAYYPIFKIKILFKKMFSNLFTCVAEQKM